jgi:hypothetical protein
LFLGGPYRKAAFNISFGKPIGSIDTRWKGKILVLIAQIVEFMVQSLIKYRSRECPIRIEE